jgi:MFS family permease
MVECLANDWKVWLAGKILGGLGVGCLQSGLPTYISEIAPTRTRGALLMCYSLWFTTGQFFAPVALQIMSEKNAHDWKTAIYTQWSQIGLMFLIYLGLPESPAWCVTRGKTDQAKKMLRYLYKGVTDFDVEHQFNLLVLNLEHERAVAAEQKNEKWYAIFKGRDGFRTLVSCWTLMCQQWVGLGLFFGLGTYFFQQAGIADPFKVTCITSGINIAFSIIIIFLADTTGRRWLACYGTTLCWFCCVVTGILGVAPKTEATNKAFVAFVCFWSKFIPHTTEFGGVINSPG